MIEEKILPCPFCGKEAGLNTVTYSKDDEQAKLNKQWIWYYVSCYWCGSNNRFIMGHRSESAAIQRWNNRVEVKQNSC